MVSVLAYSGILHRKSNVFSKLNFQNPNYVRNLNASIPNYLAGLSTAAENGFGNFGILTLADKALFGSLEKDWGSAEFKEKLNLSSANYKENFQAIQAERGDIIFFGALQSAIKETAKQYGREAIPKSVQEIWEDFGPLLEKLNKPFNKEDFQKEYNKICKKYKSEDRLFEQEVIDPIIKNIKRILRKSTPTSDDIETIKEQLGKHIDVALRIVNKTDVYHPDFGVVKYNEVHLPPLSQFMEGFFIVDDGQYDYIEENLELYKTTKDVREILFIPEEHHTEENFKQLTSEQKESFKRFFGIDRHQQELTFLVYKKKIDIFFKNQTAYVNDIIKNLDNCKSDLEKENDNYKETYETYKQIEEIDKLRSSLLDSIDRKNLPKLLEKPFLLQLFDSQSQTTKTKAELITEIESSSTISQKQTLALFYVGIGVLDFKEAQKIITFDSLTIDELKLQLQAETEGRRKIIIETALDIEAIKKYLTVENLKELCGLVVDYYGNRKFAIINKGLDIENIKKDLTFEDLKELCGLLRDDKYKLATDLQEYVDLCQVESHRKSIIINKGLDIENIKKDLTFEKLKELCGLVVYDGYIFTIIEKALDIENIKKDLTFEKLKELCDLVGNNKYKKFTIIEKALDIENIKKDLTFEKLKELCGLVGDYKFAIINKGLDIENIKKDLTVDKLKKLCGLFEDDKYKFAIIKKALEKKAIKDPITVENLTKLCALVGDVNYKREIIKIALEEKAIENIEGYNEKQLTDIIMSPPPPVTTRAYNYVKSFVVCGSASKK